MTRRVKTAYPGIFYRDGAGGRTYEIMYTDSLGKRRSETVSGGLRDAQRARAAVLERMHRGERVSPSKMTVKDLGEDFLRTQTSHLKASTRKRYEYDIDRYVVPIVGTMKVAKVDDVTVLALIADLREGDKEVGRKPLSEWAIRGALTVLSRLFVYAVRKGWASRNPVKALDRGERPSGNAKEMLILSSEEIGAVVRAVTPTYKLLILTAIFTGLRIGELLRLEWSDVDWKKGQLIVRESKTDAGVRRVDIAPFLLKELSKASLELTPYDLDPLLPEPPDNVFLTRDGTPMKHRRVNRALDETLKRAKVKHVRFHDLRHTFASILISNGESVAYVADQMGHSSPAITLSIYVKLFDAQKASERAKERMQAAFAGVVA